MLTTLSRTGLEQDEGDPDEILGGIFDESTTATAHSEDPGTKVAIFVGRVRGMVLSEMQRTGVTTSEMANRVGVSVSAVSRQLRSEGDMKASTAVILASALGKTLKLVWADASAATSTRAPLLCYEKTILNAVPLVGVWPDRNVSNRSSGSVGGWWISGDGSVPHVIQQAVSTSRSVTGLSWDACDSPDAVIVE